MLIPSDLLPADGRFGAGPSRIPASHLELDARWMGTSHRAAPVKNVIGDIREGLSQLFQLPEGYEVILGNGGASLLWDALGFNIVTDRAQAVVCGAFSGKAASCLDGHPNVSQVETITVAPGNGSTNEARPGIDTYIYPHNETSTGVMLPITRVGDGLMVVDGTSAAGGVQFDVSHTDFYYFSAQKCFASDGGLWFALVSPACVERIESLKGRWTPPILDLNLALENSRANQTLNTPALATAAMMHAQVEWMLDNGGLDGMDTRTRTTSDLIYRWVEETPWAHGFAAPDYRSRTVVTIEVDRDATEIVRIARENGLVDIGGYRGIGRNQIRIATFPGIDRADIEALLSCLTWIGERTPAV